MKWKTLFNMQQLCSIVSRSSVVLWGMPNIHGSSKESRISMYLTWVHGKEHCFRRDGLNPKP